MSKALPYIIFIAVTVGLGIFSGVANAPGDWYQSLDKPFFNPPPWVFAPVWTILYVLIGVAGARTWMRAPASAAMQLWFIQLILNFLWSPAFFGLESPLLGLLVVLAMLVTISGFIMTVRPIDRLARMLFIPYVAWVAFASLLNLSILMLN